MEYILKEKKRRNKTLVLTADPVVATYTLDNAYVAYRTVLFGDDEEEERKVLPFGTVVAFNPFTRKVVPHYTSYGFEPVGPITRDANCGVSNIRDTAVSVVWRAVVDELACYDEGVYGTVLQATKSALSNRVHFVKESHFE